MEDSQLKQLKYLIESGGNWKPDQLVMNPWEIGLTSKSGVHNIVRRTTVSIQRAMEKQYGSNDA